jgi:hypothetical protein
MKRILHLFCLLILSLSFFSCTEEAEDVSSINKQTTIVFMPWAGNASSSNLYSYFMQNLDSIEGAIKKAGSMSNRVVVFLSTSSSESELFEITLVNKEIQHTTLKTYTGNLYTTADGISQILDDVKSNAFALNYSLIIGCHGVGWTYKGDWTDYPYGAKSRESQTSATKSGIGKVIPYHPTRFYGSVSDPSNYGTDIETLEQGIANAGMKMQYILFDDCYMANIETAYQLKDVTNFLIGSTSEVMAEGMPYQTMWSSLSSATPAYETITSAFNSFYSNFEYPYGTLAVIDCKKLDKLAEIMRKINNTYLFDSSQLDSVQVLDGFNQGIFYDMKDYVLHLCKNNDILNDFSSDLQQAVKSSVHTDSIYSAIYNTGKVIKINQFSGITISDPSINSIALKGKEKTAWWKATH